jgi:hypothetical protein
MRSAKTKKFVFGLAFLLLGFQVSLLFSTAFLANWMVLRGADAISEMLVKNRADYERLVAALMEHGYRFEPWPPDQAAGYVVIYGDVRPLAPLIAEVAGGRVSVFTRGFEPSLQSFIPIVPWGGPIAVFSTSAMLLGALLWAAALVATAWYVASRRLLSLPASLVIVLVPSLPYVAEVGFLLRFPSPTWVVLPYASSAIAPPALLLLGFAIAKARRA